MQFSKLVVQLQAQARGMQMYHERTGVQKKELVDIVSVIYDKLEVSRPKLCCGSDGIGVVVYLGLISVFRCDQNNVSLIRRCGD